MAIDSPFRLVVYYLKYLHFCLLLFICMDYSMFWPNFCLHEGFSLIYFLYKQVINIKVVSQPDVVLNVNEGLFCPSLVEISFDNYLYVLHLDCIIDLDQKNKFKKCGLQFWLCCTTLKMCVCSLVSSQVLHSLDKSLTALSFTLLSTRPFYLGKAKQNQKNKDSKQNKQNKQNHNKTKTITNKQKTPNIIETILGTT